MARPAIIDIYLPGDVIGLDGSWYARPQRQVRTLTAAIIETVPAECRSVPVLSRVMNFHVA
jgi:hypothetical protein